MWNDLSYHFNNSDMTVKATILNQGTRGMDRYFLAQVERQYSGCDIQYTSGRTEEIILRTSTSSAACGVGLTTGETYVLSTYNTGDAYRGRNIYSIGLCNYHTQEGFLTRSESEFLNSRQRDCPRQGISECGDGSFPVSCLVDPCMTAPLCRGGDCEANYCGGCNYEYFDIEGTKVCPTL
jgi:hypothetical protein